MPPKKYFISFGDESYKEPLNRLTTQASLLNCFDVIYGYTDKDLESYSDFWDIHGEFVKNNPRGYGYWIWKSYLSLKTLNEMEDGDILLYADAGCEMNYDGIQRLDELFKKVETNRTGFLSFQLNDLMYHQEERWTKMDLLKHFNHERYGTCLQLHSTYYFLRKGDFLMNIINLWYNTSSIYHFIDDSPSISKNSDYFCDHRHDQSVFSLIRKVHDPNNYILNEHDNLETRFPILDHQNKTGKSEIYQKKTVIHTWTQKVVNMTKTKTENFWGLGDIIRGTIKLYQLSKKMDFELIVDIQHHPISRFLKCTNTKYPDLIRNHKDNINFVLPGKVEEYIKSSKYDVVIFLTNDLCDENDIDDECKEFIRKIFTPNSFFEEYISVKKTELCINEYNIIHYRLGDQELIHKNNSQSLLEYFNHLQKNKEDNDLLISDSESFKNYVKQNTKIDLFNTNTAHLGYEQNPSKTMDTLFELFLIIDAKKIKTYSIYSWISGFVYWIHKIYDIPLEKI